MSNTTEFLTELKTLLEKYNATIEFTCDSSSDTHGLTGTCIQVKIADTVVLKNNDWELTHFDIR